MKNNCSQNNVRGTLRASAYRILI